MKLKEVLKDIKKTDDINIWYKNPKDKYNSIIRSGAGKYLEVEVKSYKKCIGEYIDPFSGKVINQICHEIELNWDELKIIKEAEIQNRKRQKTFGTNVKSLVIDNGCHTLLAREQIEKI